MEKKAKFWNGPYLVFLLSIVLASATDSTLINVLPVYVLDHGGTNSMAGAMITGLTVASILTRLVCGPLTDKFGRKRLLVIGSTSYALNALAYCFAPNLGTVIALRVLNGITQGIFFPVPPTLVADLVPRQRLVDGMGFFGVASSISFAVAPTISLAVYEAWGPSFLFGWITLTAAASAVLTFLIRVGAGGPAALEEPPQPRRFGVDTIFDRSVAGLGAVNLLLMLGSVAISNFTVAFGLSRGIEGIALFTVVVNGTALVTKLLVGSMVRKVSQKGLVTLCCLLEGGAAVVLAFSYSLPAALAGAALYGFGNAVTSQLLQVMVIEKVEDRRRGVAMATFSLFGDVGSGVGGTAAGTVSQHLGYTAAYLFSALTLGLAGCVGGIGSLRKRKRG